MSDFLPWKKIYSVDVKEIDEQHKDMFRIVGRLHDAIKYNVEYKTIKNVLIELIDYTQKHFGTEEKYFTSFNYPQGTRHKEEHAEFVSKILEFTKEFREGINQKLSQDVLNFLQNWIIKHILGTDMMYKGKFKSSHKEFKTLNHVD